jgi:hypothetical protein
MCDHQTITFGTNPVRQKVEAMVAELAAKIDREGAEKLIEEMEREQRRIIMYRPWWWRLIGFNHMVG